MTVKYIDKNSNLSILGFYVQMKYRKITLLDEFPFAFTFNY